MPRGWLHRLTWLPRRIELVRDEEGSVTGFVRCVHVGLADGTGPDPMVAYRRDEKRGLLPVGIVPDRAFWRDANVLFGSTYDDPRAERFLRARTIAQVCAREVQHVLGAEARFRVVLLGVATDQSRVEVTRAESLVAHARLFADPIAGGAIERALGHAETGVKALDSALFEYARHALSPGARSPDTKDIRALVQSFHAGPAAWSALGEAFQTFLRDLEDDADAAERRFAQRVLDVVRDELRRATARADATSGWLKAGARAEVHLSRGLRPIVRAAAAPTANPSPESPG